MPTIPDGWVRTTASVTTCGDKSPGHPPETPHHLRHKNRKQIRFQARSVVGSVYIKVLADSNSPKG